MKTMLLRWLGGLVLVSGLCVGCGSGGGSDELCSFYENMFGWRLMHSSMYVCGDETNATACLRAEQSDPTSEKVRTCLSSFAKRFNEDGGNGDPFTSFFAYANDPSNTECSGFSPSTATVCLQNCSRARSLCQRDRACSKDAATCNNCNETCIRTWSTCRSACTATN